MRPPRAILGLAILTLAVVAALLLLEGSGVEGPPGPASREASRSEARGTARLEGVGDATPPRGAPTEGPGPTDDALARALHGIVRSDDGTPIAGASVYVGDKYASEQEKGETFRSTTTDAEGLWRLDSVVLRGHWICAVADGFLPAHLDGDRPPADRPIVFELEPGPEIRVTVTGLHGEPLDRTFYVYVRNAEGGRRAPGSGGSLEFSIRADIAPGEREVRIRLCTRDEVEVHGHYPHGDSDVQPRDQRIMPPNEDIRIRVVPRCVLDLRAIDADSGDPLPKRMRVALFAGIRRAHGGSGFQPGGRYREYVRAPIGTYRLRIEAVGYRTHEETEVTFARPGEVVAVEVRMERDPTVGDIRVNLPLLPTLPTEQRFDGEDAPPRAEFLWLIPAPPDEADGDSATAGRTWVGDWGRPRLENGIDYVFEGRPAGEVALLVFNVPSKCVAFEPHVRVEAGRTTSISLALQPGVFVDPESFKSLHEDIVGVTVRHPRFGTMPTFFHTGMSFSYADPGEQFMPETPWGPYPGPEVTVELRLWEGEVATRTFRIASEDR